MKNVNKLMVIFIGTFVVLFVTGCMPARQPVMISPELLQQQPTTISILPSIDARREKESAKIKDLDEITQKYIRGQLKRRKYKVEILDHYAIDHHEGYLAEMTEDELVSLAPENTEAAFLYVLDDATSNNIIISNSARAIARAYLIDPVKKEIIWKDEESHSTGGGGLLYSMVPMKNMAIEMTIYEMVESLPKRGSKPKQ